MAVRIVNQPPRPACRKDAVPDNASAPPIERLAMVPGENPVDVQGS